MKPIKYIIPVLLLFLFASCDKSLELGMPTFEVTGYTVADGLDSVGNPVKKVTFTFDGDAKFASMYSGEVFHDYSYAQGRTLSYTSLQLSFSTTWQFGAQLNQFSVWASTDFDGTYTPERVNAATWTNITSRFTLATVNGSTAPTPSGIKDINDLKVEGKPIYIGFKYVTLPQTANGLQTSWRVRNFLITGQSDIGPIVLADQATNGWMLTNEGAVIDPTRAIIETGPIVLLRGNSINTNIQTTTWAIGKAVNASKSNLGPDLPIAIKSYAETSIRTFTYTYPKTGTYNVTFVATNTTLGNNDKVVKTITINVN
jgi:hypothetical protein